VDNVIVVQILQGQNDAGASEFGVSFREYFDFADVQPEVTASQQIHDEL